MIDRTKFLAEIREVMKRHGVREINATYALLYNDDGILIGSFRTLTVEGFDEEMVVAPPRRPIL